MSTSDSKKESTDPTLDFASAVADAAKAVESGAPAVQGEVVDVPVEEPSADDRVAALEQSVLNLKDRLLRSAADFENWKKRAKKENEEASLHGREALVKEIIPALDNLERALKHAAGDDPLATGIRLVEKQLVAALEKFGVTRFSAMGQGFDPMLHDAIQHKETTEFPPGTVAEEFSSGYMNNNKLLRAAMVAVAKPPAGEGE